MFNLFFHNRFEGSDRNLNRLVIVCSLYRARVSSASPLHVATLCGPCAPGSSARAVQNALTRRFRTFGHAAIVPVLRHLLPVSGCGRLTILL